MRDTCGVCLAQKLYKLHRLTRRRQISVGPDCCRTTFGIATDNARPVTFKDMVRKLLLGPALTRCTRTTHRVSSGLGCFFEAWPVINAPNSCPLVLLAFRHLEAIDPGFSTFKSSQHFRSPDVS